LETDSQDGVFSGITILSFCEAVVGPLTMKFFADHGATVIRVESHTHPCTMRTSAPYRGGKPGLNRGGYFNHFNTNILSLTLNMKHPQAIEVARKLVVRSDVVMENRPPRVMENWGLGYEELKKLKPDIIMLRQSGFGSGGPYAHLRAFGMVLAPMAGLLNFVGYQRKEPLPIGVSAYTDCISPRFAAAALVAALDYRNKTGRGQVIELSEFETALYFIMPAILEYLSSGREPARMGNSSLYAVPHGVYPCQGDDRWCAIAVYTDQEWGNLCRHIGKPEYISDPRFDTLISRKKNESEVDKIVGEWTARHTAEEVMEHLQTAGVPAGVVKNTADLYHDPQLKERNLFWQINHPESGLITHLGQSFQLSNTPARPYRPSPLIGEHTEYVCSRILGMSDDEFVTLMQAGVFE
jgi:benzylsuccinate CoA-transferase BbsF subunit